MEYKNNGIPKEIIENGELASNSTSTTTSTPTIPIKTSKTISSAIKLIKKVEEENEDIIITSGTILCNCFTCGHPVCAPMSTDNLTKQGSSLDTSSISAYQQKVSTLARTQYYIFKKKLSYLLMTFSTF